MNIGSEQVSNPFFIALKYTNLLPFRDRLKFLILAIFNLALALVDITALVILGLATVKSFDLPQDNENNSLNTLTDILGALGIQSLVQLFTLVAVLFIIRNLLSLFVTKMLLRIVASHQVVVGRGLFRSYLRGSQRTLDQLKEQEKLHMLTDSMNAATLGMLASFTLASSELILLFLLALFIVAYNFTAGLTSVFFFSLVFLLIQRKLGSATRKTLDKYTIGNIETRNLVSEVSKNLVEIRLGGTAGQFVSEFEKMKKSTVGLYSKSVFLSQLPKFVLELAVILGGCLIAAWAFTFNDEGAAIKLLAIYIGLSLRILPSLLRLQGFLMNTYSASGYSKLYLDEIFQMEERDIKLLFEGSQIPESKLGNKKDFLSFLQIDSVEFSYPHREWVLKIPTFTIKTNEVVCIQGASGSGKTTFVKLMLGELVPNEGSIDINGVPIREWVSFNPNSLAYVSQNTNLITGSILENVTLGVPLANIDQDLLFDSLKSASLETFVKNLPKGVHTNIKDLHENLSGGQIQRIGLARAFYTKPRLLILDEPTSALDIATREEIEKVIKAKQNDTGIILISHNVSKFIEFDRTYEIGTTAGISTLIELT